MKRDDKTQACPLLDNKQRCKAMVTFCSAMLEQGNFYQCEIFQGYSFCKLKEEEK